MPISFESLPKGTGQREGTRRGRIEKEDPLFGSAESSFAQKKTDKITKISYV